MKKTKKKILSYFFPLTLGAAVLSTTVPFLLSNQTIQNTKLINQNLDINTNNQSLNLTPSSYNNFKDVSLEWNIPALEKDIKKLQDNPTLDINDLSPEHQAIIQNPLFKTIRNLGINRFINIYNQLLVNYKSSVISLNDETWTLPEPNNQYLLDSVFNFIVDYNGSWTIEIDPLNPSAYLLNFSSSTTTLSIKLNFQTETLDPYINQIWSSGESSIAGFWINNNLIPGTTTLNNVDSYINSSINSVWTTSSFTIANLIFGDMQKIFPWSDKVIQQNGKEIFDTSKWVSKLITLSDNRTPNVLLVSSLSDVIEKYKHSPEALNLILSFEIIDRETNEDIWQNGRLLQTANWLDLSKKFTLEQSKYFFKFKATATTKYGAESTFITYLTNFQKPIVDENGSNLFDWSKFLSSSEASKLHDKGVSTSNLSFNNLSTFYNIDLDKLMSYDELVKKISPSGEFKNLSLVNIKNFLNPKPPVLTEFSDTSTIPFYDIKTKNENQSIDLEDDGILDSKELQDAAIKNFGKNLGIFPYEDNHQSFIALDNFKAKLNKPMELINKFKKTLLDVARANIHLFSNDEKISDEKLIEILNGTNFNSGFNLFDGTGKIKIGDIIVQSVFSSNTYTTNNITLLPQSLTKIKLVSENEYRDMIINQSPKTFDQVWLSNVRLNVEKYLYYFVLKDKNFDTSNYKKPVFIETNIKDENNFRVSFRITSPENTNFTYTFIGDSSSFKYEFDSNDSSAINKTGTFSISREAMLKLGEADVSKFFNYSVSLQDIILTNFMTITEKEYLLKITQEQKDIILDTFKLLTGIDLKLLAKTSFNQEEQNKLNNLFNSNSDNLNTINELGWYWNISSSSLASFDEVKNINSPITQKTTTSQAAIILINLLLSLTSLNTSSNPTFYSSDQKPLPQPEQPIPPTPVPPDPAPPVVDPKPPVGPDKPNPEPLPPPPPQPDLNPLPPTQVNQTLSAVDLGFDNLTATEAKKEFTKQFIINNKEKFFVGTLDNLDVETDIVSLNTKLTSPATLEVQITLKEGSFIDSEGLPSTKSQIFTISVIKFTSTNLLVPSVFYFSDPWYSDQNFNRFNINLKITFLGGQTIEWAGLENVGSPIEINSLTNFNSPSKWLNLDAAQLGKAIVVHNYVFIPLFNNENYAPSQLGIYSQKWLVFSNVAGSHPDAKMSLYDFLLALSGKVENGLSSSATIAIIVVLSIVGLLVLGGLFFWYVIAIHRTKTKKIKEKELVKVDTI